MFFLLFFVFFCPVKVLKYRLMELLWKSRKQEVSLVKVSNFLVVVGLHIHRKIDKHPGVPFSLERTIIIFPYAFFLWP